MDNLEMNDTLMEEIESLSDDEVFSIAILYDNGINFDGILYEGKEDDDSDDIKANKLFNYLMKKGNESAQHCLGCNYKDGKGVKRNINKAIELLTPLVENEYVEAISDLGYCYELINENKKAFELYEKAVLLGDERSLYNLARCYCIGLGVKRNFDLAYNYFTKIESMKGYSGSACYYIGLIHLEKEFTGYNVNKGIEYLEKAIDKGCYWSYSELGPIYIDGKVVKRDCDKGIKYLQRGVMLDDKASCANLAYAYEKGKGIKKDYKMALKYYKKAIDLGFYDCEDNYNEILEKINNEEKKK